MKVYPRIRNDNILPELYEQMKQIHLAGEFHLEKSEKYDSIHWNISGYFIDIGRDYIGIFINTGKLQIPITHWHPDDDEILEDIRRIGTKGNVTVIHTSILGDGVLYSGLKSECPYNKKWFLGKYHYIYAE